MVFLSVFLLHGLCHRQAAYRQFLVDRALESTVLPDVFKPRSPPFTDILQVIKVGINARTTDITNDFRLNYWDLMRWL